MGRMLQALKNLEARSAWPDARKSVLAHLAADPQPAAAALAIVAPPPVPAAAPVELPISLLPQWQPEPPNVVFEAPTLTEVTAYAPVFVAPPSPIAEPTPVRPASVSAAPATAAPLLVPPAVSPPAARPTSRAPVGLELAVRRALGEPHRRQPLRELADRLRQDAQETGSRTLLFVGIGAASMTHEAVLHVAALLADEGGRVLLVDGDLARCPLSLDLDAVQQAGLSDLLAPTQPSRDLLQPTAFTGLSFLPAGTQRHADLAGAADRLTRGLGELAGDFDLALIDGGRAGDPAVTALARLADATYVVVQLGVVEASAAQAALRDLRASGARVLGCIATE